MGKGSRQRTLNTDKFNDSYDLIFGAKKDDTDRRIPRQQEEKCADTKTSNSISKGESLQ